MPHIRIELPSALSELTGAPRSLELDADTLRQALDRLVAEHPRLAVHLFDESGAFRRHVFCWLNRTNTRWIDSLDRTLADGDVVTVMQAVSGG